MDPTEKLRLAFHAPAPNGDQRCAIEEVREAAYALAQKMHKNAPACADRSDAVRKLRESVMTYEASILLDGAV